MIVILLGPFVKHSDRFFTSTRSGRIPPRLMSPTDKCHRSDCSGCEGIRPQWIKVGTPRHLRRRGPPSDVHRSQSPPDGRVEPLRLPLVHRLLLLHHRAAVLRRGWLFLPLLLNNRRSHSNGTRRHGRHDGIARGGHSVSPPPSHPPDDRRATEGILVIVPSGGGRDREGRVI